MARPAVARYRAQLFTKFLLHRGGAGEVYPPIQGELPEIFIPGQAQRAYPFKITDDVKFDIGGDTVVTKNLRPSYLKARKAALNLKAYFSREYPGLRYRRCLGWGGNGLAAAFDHLTEDGHMIRSLVVKMLFSDDIYLVKEEKHQNAEHIIQVVFIDGIDQGTTIGTPMDIDMPDKELHGYYSVQTQPNVLITEMMENGDLANFIARVRLHNEKFPNAILWRLLLCLVRMCIGLAYPPINQGIFDNPAPIRETLPANPAEPSRRIVHFDFDPWNIFVGDVGKEFEHSFTPLIKLGDFGLATEVKPNQDDLYYERLREYGKTGFFSPEQFSIRWDFIPPDSNTVQFEPVAGNYDTHTNVWAIGCIMECLITLCRPASPPKPTRTSCRPPSGKTVYYTYGAHLEQNVYSHVDRDLVAIAIRCQAHVPRDRPTLRDLEVYVRAMISQKGNDDKTEDELRQWVQKILYNPPPPAPRQSWREPVILGSGPRTRVWHWARRRPQHPGVRWAPY
ncbi:kinase-like domain-containing protein [Xylaria intraflava]|nr:kinase-like domain-containing protein [Xylaria intraflava]